MESSYLRVNVQKMLVDFTITFLKRILKKILFYLLVEREEGREKEERNINVSH